MQVAAKNANFVKMPRSTIEIESAAARRSLNKGLTWNDTALGLLVGSFGIAVFYGLSAFYGFGFLHDKISEFCIHNLSKLGRQRPFLTTVAFCLIAEIFVIGYGKSSLKRLLNPSNSARTDLYFFFGKITGIYAFVVAAMTLGASEWLPMILRRLFSFDILFFIATPWVKFTVIFLVLDVAKYWDHRLRHTWKWCWEAHKFHHSATEMTMITGLRDHPLDGMTEILIVGIPAAMLGFSGLAALGVFNALSVVLFMLHHSNIGWSWGWVGKYVICSPRFHQIHHSLHEDHLNKNYGETIIIWDSIFGTRYDGPIEPIQFGCKENDYDKDGLVRDLREGTRRVYFELGDAIMRRYQIALK